MYYVLQNQATPDTVPGSPTMIYVGSVVGGSMDPGANYKKIRGAGQLDFVKLHKMSEKPSTSVKIEVSRIGYLKAVIDDVWHVIAFYNATYDQTIRWIGAKINTADISCSNEDSLMLDLAIEARSCDSNAVSGATYAAATTDLTDFTGVEISVDATPITDWVSCSMRIDNQLIRRLNSNARTTRALERVERENEFKFARDIDDATALDEFQNIQNDTEFDFKFKVTDPTADVWSCTFGAAKYMGLTQDVFEPGDLLGKEMTGSGSTITYGTS